MHLVKLLAIAQLDRHPYNRDLEHSIMLGGLKSRVRIHNVEPGEQGGQRGPDVL